MSSVLDLKPKPTQAGTNGEELFHFYCCDEDLGLCGIDLRNVPETDGSGELRCIVCFDLVQLACEVCGE